MKQYIESGILESYLLGEVSEQERREVECLTRIYPELREELDLQAAVLEKVASTLARPVPAGHKESVMTAITGVDPETGDDETQPVRSGSPRYLQWVAAASVVLAMFFGYRFLDQARKNDLVNTELEDKREEAARYQVALERDSVVMQHLADPNTRMINLAGTEKYADQQARVFWNAETRQTYVVMDDLTPAPAGLTYQLWAIVNGVPLDLGVYDRGSRLLEPNLFEKADAFAITLETAGGNETPNLDELVVIGDV